MQASTSRRSEMFSLIEEWKQSGLSQQAFCREKNFRYHQFHYWYKVYRVYREESQAVSQPVSTFLPLHVKENASARPLMELVLADGKRLVFHHQPSVDLLKALL